MSTGDERVLKAYHEAAHAVVACFAGARFTSASVHGAEESDERRVLAGMLQREADLTLQQVPTEVLQSRVKVALAGEAAVSILQGRQEPDWQRLSMTDRQTVLIFLSPLTNDPRNFDAEYHRLWGETLHEVRRRWPSVEEVAVALLDRGLLQKNEVHAILRQADK